MSNLTRNRYEVRALMGDDGVTKEEMTHNPNVGNTALGDFASSKESNVQKEEIMRPRIRRVTDDEKALHPDIKWVVVSRYECENRDLCRSLGSAIRFWLWHMGVSPKIAFGWFSNIKRNKDDE